MDIMTNPTPADWDISAPNLQDRLILITGTTRGIGLETAHSFARQGARLILHGRRNEPLEALRQKIEAEGGQVAGSVCLDLETARPGDYEALAEQISRHYGQPDGVLLNAGLLGEKSRIEDYPEDVWTRTLHVNINSQFYLIRHLLPALRERPDGRILFTSSSVGRAGRAEWGAYSVSKFATEGLMQTLADEFRNSPLRINSVNPGGTRTAMRASAYPEEQPDTVKAPDALMPLYSYLMSSESRMIHGRMINY